MKSVLSCIDGEFRTPLLMWKCFNCWIDPKNTTALSVGFAKEKVLQVRSLDPKTQLLSKPHVLCFCRASFDEQILKTLPFWSVGSACVTVLQPEKRSEEVWHCSKCRQVGTNTPKITKSYYIWTLTVKCGFCVERTKTCWSTFTFAGPTLKMVVFLGSIHQLQYFLLCGPNT